MNIHTSILHKCLTIRMNLLYLRFFHCNGNSLEHATVKKADLSKTVSTLGESSQSLAALLFLLLINVFKESITSAVAAF